MRDGAVVARRAHNPKVLGSSPSPATEKKSQLIYIEVHLFDGFFSLECGE